MSGMETEKEYRNNEDVQEEKPAGQAEEKPADPVQDHASALKKKKRRILIAAGAAAAIVIAYFCYSGWMQLPWMQNKYFLVHGIPAKQQWVQDGDSYYYMDENGRMSEGLQTVDGNHYYFDEETGVMQTGWIEEGLQVHRLADCRRGGILPRGRRKHADRLGHCGRRHLSAG